MGRLNLRTQKKKRKKNLDKLVLVAVKDLLNTIGFLFWIEAKRMDQMTISSHEVLGNLSIFLGSF